MDVEIEEFNDGRNQNCFYIIIVIIIIKRSRLSLIFVFFKSRRHCTCVFAHVIQPKKLAEQKGQEKTIEIFSILNECLK